MEVTFLKSKSDHPIFSINNQFYHSYYSPVKEAERFVSIQQFDYEPEVLIIIEPGFSYCYESIKKRLPDTKIGVIRIIPDIKDGKDWDFCINYDDFSKEKLLELFTAEEILCTDIRTWPIAEKLFKTELFSILSEIKKAFSEAQTLLVTRQYFEKRWLLNSCSKFKFLKTIVKYPSKIDLPVVITASGPSLKTSISPIQENRNKIFLLGLSSSLSVLLENNIYPDFILSTDGGYWAGEHLKKLNKNNLTLGIPFEAYCPGQIIENNNMIPFVYGDELLSPLLDKLHIPVLILERNGTVSGSALKFAQSFTTNKIFFCGLDLASGTGYDHLQPNELELNNKLKDNRLKTVENRITASKTRADSLLIYRNWFCNLQNTKNVYRVIQNNQQSSLGKIIDIDGDNFMKILKDFSAPHETLKTSEVSVDFSKEYIHELLNYIDENINSYTWQKQLFPLDFVSLIHCSNNDDKMIVEARIKQNTIELLSRIRKIFHEQ